MIENIQKNFHESIQVKQKTLENTLPKIQETALLMIHTLQNKGKILACGNGGSAGDAQHFASELMNRYETERSSLPVIALSADSLTLTAIANDYHYRDIFSRQIKAIGNPGDLLFVFSTSGNSENILEAVRAAQQRHLPVVALTGKNGGNLARLLQKQDIEIRIPSHRTARIQETHLLIIHCLCNLIDEKFTT